MKQRKEYYCCKKLRLLEALLNAGFEPYATIPDSTNWKYKNWLFYNDEKLEEFLENYFAKYKK
jgi:hypothetical protein